MKNELLRSLLLNKLQIYFYVFILYIYIIILYNIYIIEYMVYEHLTLFLIFI